MKSMTIITIILLVALMIVGCPKGKVENLEASEPQVSHREKETDIVKVLMKTSMGDIELELDRAIAPLTVDNFVGLAMGTKPYTDPRTGEETTGHFYDGLIFHRVIKDFMIQGGCPIGNGSGGPGYRFEDECYGDGEPISGAVDTDEKAYLVFHQLIVPHLDANRERSNPQIIDVMNRCQAAQSYDPVKANDIAFYETHTGLGPLTQRKLLASVDYGTICMANSGPNTNGSQFFIVTKRDGCSWLDGKHTVFGKVTRGMDVAHAIEDSPKGPNDRPTTEVKIISVRIDNS